MSPTISRRMRTRFAVLSLMASSALMGSASPAFASPVFDTVAGLPGVVPTVGALAGAPVVGPIAAAMLPIVAGL